MMEQLICAFLLGSVVFSQEGISGAGEDLAKDAESSLSAFGQSYRNSLDGGVYDRRKAAEAYVQRMAAQAEEQRLAKEKEARQKAARKNAQATAEGTSVPMGKDGQPDARQIIRESIADRLCSFATGGMVDRMSLRAEILQKLSQQEVSDAPTLAKALSEGRGVGIYLGVYGYKSFVNKHLNHLTDDVLKVLFEILKKLG